MASFRADGHLLHPHPAADGRRRPAANRATGHPHVLTSPTRAGRPGRGRRASTAPVRWPAPASRPPARLGRADDRRGAVARQPDEVARRRPRSSSGGAARALVRSVMAVSPRRSGHRHGHLRVPLPAEHHLQRSGLRQAPGFCGGAARPPVEGGRSWPGVSQSLRQWGPVRYSSQGSGQVVVHLEHAIQPRTTENAENLLTSVAFRDQAQSTVPFRDPVPRPAQHPQTGAVDEGHAAQVHHEVGKTDGRQIVQARPERRCREDVDLTAQLHDGCPADGTLGVAGRGCDERFGHGHSKSGLMGAPEGPSGPPSPPRFPGPFSGQGRDAWPSSEAVGGLSMERDSPPGERRADS